MTEHELSLRCNHTRQMGSSWFRFADGCEGETCPECFYDLGIPRIRDLVEIDSAYAADEKKMRRLRREALLQGSSGVGASGGNPTLDDQKGER